MTTFVQDAIRTESKPDSLPIGEIALDTSLSLGIAAAKILNLVKRAIYYGKPIKEEDIYAALNELGIAAYNVQSIASEFNNLNDKNDYVQILPEQGNIVPSNVNLRLLHTALGIFTEGGELLEAMQMALRSGITDEINFKEEIGDVLYYSALASDEIKVPLEKIQDSVIAKLKKRYPTKFDADLAINRDLKAERKALEE